jgi:hypothetical protein
MTDYEYTLWLKGLGQAKVNQEEWNLHFVLSTESIPNEAKKFAARKLKLLKQFLNDSNK